MKYQLSLPDLFVQSRFILLLCLIFFHTAASADTIDLTYSFNNDTIYWPGAKSFVHHKYFWNSDRGYFYASGDFYSPEHGGTHLDAPIHFANNGWTIDKIPAEKLIGNAAVITIAINDNADYLITEDDIRNWEKKYRSLTSNDIVLFFTGWGQFYGNKMKYLGTKKTNSPDDLHFPGISQEAAHYLVKKNIKGVGLDTPSLDYGPSKDFIAHRILLEANIYGIENLTNINQLPATGATLVVAPMKIENGSGAPARVFGIVNN